MNTTINASSLQPNIKEALRYMGFRGEPDDKILSVINTLEKELKRNISPKHIVRRFSCAVSENAVIIDSITLNSKSLAKHLNGCDELFILATTLGIGADNLIRRYSITDIANSSILQAIAASLIEAYCDAIQHELELTISSENLYLKQRFSPGYGDLSINHQADIVKLLQTEKTIGLTLSDSLMMIPTKSVTAIIGISNQPCGHSSDKCSKCPQTECPYRNVQSAK